MGKKPAKNNSGAGGFFFVSLVMFAAMAAMAYVVKAPYESRFVEDWQSWAMSDTTNAGLMAILAALGIFCALAAVWKAMATPRHPEEFAQDRDLYLSDTNPAANVAPAEPLSFRPAKRKPSLQLTPEPEDSINIDTREIRDEAPRASLKFDANTLRAEPAAPMHQPVETHTVASLEPAVAADGQVQVNTESFNPEAAINNVVPLRANPQNLSPLPEHVPSPFEITDANIAADPVAKALLADTDNMPRQDAPPSDINAVITSAMRLIETPEIKPEIKIASESGLTIDAPVVETLPIAEAPKTSWVETPHTVVPGADADVKQATQMALSVWPDHMRTIAADELQRRITTLFEDKSPATQRAFSLIATGELNAAAMTLHSHADSLAQVGANAAAADIWRAYGALHMGRDDNRAMMAYEKVSELDPSDTNIHLYLIRRYQMGSDSQRLGPVLERALKVITDESTRYDLLGPLADIRLKNNDLNGAAQVLEELSRLNQARAIKDPDNISVKSAYAISLAKLAQTREMMGTTQMAGPLYKMAHEVFSELSLKVPTHEGLRAMADNALKDSQRLNFG